MVKVRTFPNPWPGKKPDDYIRWGFRRYPDRGWSIFMPRLVIWRDHGPLHIWRFR